jgi:hypothetical protein
LDQLVARLAIPQAPGQLQADVQRQPGDFAGSAVAEGRPGTGGWRGLARGGSGRIGSRSMDIRFWWWRALWIPNAFRAPFTVPTVGRSWD